MSSVKRKTVKRTVRKKPMPRRKMSKKKETTILYKGKKIPKGKQEELRERKGSGSAGKYKTVVKKDFAGPSGGASAGTFPINTLKRAINALTRAHFAPNPSGIRRAVWRKWPQLKKRFIERKSK